jgi:hypothetical protein
MSLAINIQKEETEKPQRQFHWGDRVGMKTHFKQFQKEWATCVRELVLSILVATKDF